MVIVRFSKKYNTCIGTNDMAKTIYYAVSC
jgi:hypothetical protein